MHVMQNYICVVYQNIKLCSSDYVNLVSNDEWEPPSPVLPPICIGNHMISSAIWEIIARAMH